MMMPPRISPLQRVTCSGRALILAATLALPLVGCGSPTPVPVSYPLTFQPEMESAAHWQAVAADMWEEISRRLKAGGYSETTVGPEPPATPSQFSHAMDNFLLTEIVNHGVGVSPNSAFTVTYSVQVLKYHDHDSPVIPGLFTAGAGAGLLAGAGYEDGWALGPIAAAAAPIAAGADFINGWTPSDSQSEVVLSFSVTDGSAVRIRASKVFYIPDGDAGLYQPGGGNGSGGSSKSTLLSSNWYAANPHDVDRQVEHEDNQFNLNIDRENGPLHNITEATSAAVEHCATMGKSAARYIDQGFPENDRSIIRTRFECE